MIDVIFFREYFLTRFVLCYDALTRFFTYSFGDVALNNSSTIGEEEKNLKSFVNAGNKRNISKRCFFVLFCNILRTDKFTMQHTVQTYCQWMDDEKIDTGVEINCEIVGYI